MKTLVTTCFAAVLLAATPAFAGDGHGHGHHGDKHSEKHWNKHHKHWAKHHRHDQEVVVVQQFQPVPRVIERHYVYAQPQVVYAPPPGVHVVTRNVFIPF